MPDQEQVERLKHSIEQWNQWRYYNSDIQPNLSFASLNTANLTAANLRRANLRQANLTYANLRGAHLQSADLRGATLHGTILHHADLRGASLFGATISDADLRATDFRQAILAHTNLRGAILSDADLRTADLRHADLHNAILHNADLRDADLRGANLHETLIENTIFADVDLSSVQGLATIDHRGPSVIALHNIHLPQDGSAIRFLRGVGVPDEWIDFYRTTMMHPIQYYSVFISYSSVDEQMATRLHADLQAHGVRCWFAPHDLKPGNYMRKEVDQAIHLQDKLLLILSGSAVNSNWVSYEVELALSREIEQKREILFPIRLDHEVLHNTSQWAKTLQETRHIGDFTEWTNPQIYQQTFDQLLKDLKRRE